MEKLRQMIFCRRSVRKYLDRSVTEEDKARILEHFRSTKSLWPDIRVEARIVASDEVRFYFPWRSPYLLAVYSEEKAGDLEEVGFRLQQTDLFIQSLGLGSCWLGLGKLRKDAPQVEGLRFVMLLAFGHPDGVPLRTAISQFNRRGLEDISDRRDARLEPARLAPSSTNSQPWFFVHGEDVIHVYQTQAGLLRHRMLGEMNRIDVGIALAHLYVAYPETFRTVQTDAPEVKGYRYVCSFKI